MLNVSRNKMNQTIKFGQLIQYNKYFSSNNHVENVAGRLVLDIKKNNNKNKKTKSFIWVVEKLSGKWSAAQFQCIYIALNSAYNINKLSNFRLLFQFWFFRNGSGNNFFTTFCAWFFKKNISHVNWPNFIV